MAWGGPYALAGKWQAELEKTGKQMHGGFLVEGGGRQCNVHDHEHGPCPSRVHVHVDGCVLISRVGCRAIITSFDFAITYLETTHRSSGNFMLHEKLYLSPRSETLFTRLASAAKRQCRVDCRLPSERGARRRPHTSHTHATAALYTPISMSYTTLSASLSITP